MKITVSDVPRQPLKYTTDLLAVPIKDTKLSSPLGRALDQSLQGLLSKILRTEEIKGKLGDARTVDCTSFSILLLGVGDTAKLDEETLRKLSARAMRTGKRLKSQRITLEIPSLPKSLSLEDCGQAIAEGAVLGSYSFNQYKSPDKNNKNTVQEFQILSSQKNALQKGISRGLISGHVTNLARDLINIPATDMTPRRMTEEARRIGKLPHLSVRIYDKKQIQKMGMGCYLAVASGSTEPPYFIHLTYRPITRPKKKLALIGKGVTFDSGGLSLKTAQSMETMKDDMSGAAAMLAVMEALSASKAPIEVHGISAVTENMPSGSADKPGDIARAMNGKTVEILNTDAEGRLTLADAISYAQKLKPDLMIDMATLTGACVIALGELCSAIMGNHQSLIDDLIAAGRKSGEKIWPLPLIEEYKEDLKSPIADLKNVGGRWGGAINGGLFIQEFVDPKIPWAHLDIAGPSWTEKELDYCSRGGTGFGVRTILNFIRHLGSS